MLDASDYLKAYGIFRGIGIVIAVGVYNMLYENALAFKIFIDSLILQIPVASDIVRMFYISKFTSLLAQFYAA
ncbi:hypothetical protein IJM86_08615 [bacterium]|nr:hypothetical protein [bacterium]